MSELLKALLWVAISVLGAGALAKIALQRGESLSAIWFVLAAVCVYLVAYRLYSAFVAAKILALDDTRATPPRGVTMVATLCPRTSGFCSVIISPPSLGRGRW